MNNSRQIILAFFAAVLFVGCATETFEQARVRVGMSREDLRFYFGEPLRIEATDWGEDWYYRFVVAESPLVGAAVAQDVYGESGSVAVDLSGAPELKAVWPIHLSREGYVIEPIPEGRILGR
jgi:hypothetical protein